MPGADCAAADAGPAEPSPRRLWSSARATACRPPGSRMPAMSNTRIATSDSALPKKPPVPATPVAPIRPPPMASAPPVAWVPPAARLALSAAASSSASPPAAASPRAVAPPAPAACAAAGAFLLSTTSAVRISGRPSGWKCSARSERLVRRMYVGFWFGRDVDAGFV
eukprot:364463-Chlamydomonas_euryale.AAC.13